MSPHKHERGRGLIRVPWILDSPTLMLAAPCASVSPAQLSPEGHSHCGCLHVLPAPLHPQTTGSTRPLPAPLVLPWGGRTPACLSFPTPPTHAAAPPLRCRQRPRLTTQTTRCPCAPLPGSPPGPPARGGRRRGAGRPVAAATGSAAGEYFWSRSRLSNHVMGTLFKAVASPPGSCERGGSVPHAPSRTDPRVAPTPDTRVAAEPPPHIRPHPPASPRHGGSLRGHLEAGGFGQFR